MLDIRFPFDFQLFLILILGFFFILNQKKSLMFRASGIVFFRVVTMGDGWVR